jgi:hypothetical protein
MNGRLLQFPSSFSRSNLTNTGQRFESQTVHVDVEVNLSSITRVIARLGVGPTFEGTLILCKASRARVRDSYTVNDVVRVKGGG